MIQNNSLSDRLNEFKNESSIPETNPNVDYIKPIFSLIESLISLAVIFVKSFAFGYGLMTLLKVDWNFLGYMSVGLSTALILDFIINAISYFSSNT